MIYAEDNKTVELKTYEFTHSRGSVRIRAINGLTAQLKYRKKYDIDFISYREVKND